MPAIRLRLPLVSIPLVALLSAIAAAAPGQDWPNWRGPHHNGAAAAEAVGDGLPVTFDQTEGVRWKVDLPGPGASTPIVSGDRIYLTAVDSGRHELVAMCLNAGDGEVLWARDAGSGYGGVEGEPAPVAGARANFASPSPVVDDERAVFFFGNGDLVSYTLAGEEVWRRNLQVDHGPFAFNWTFSATPTLFEGTLYIPVLQRDVPVGRQGNRRGDQAEAAEPIESFILALDPATGKVRFRHVRPSPAKVESLESYTTIVPAEVSGATQLLLAGGDVLTGHDPATGAELWRWGTWNEGHRQRFWRLVPTVVVGDGVALVCAPKKAPVYALDLERLAAGADADGEPRDPLLWRSEGRPNPVSSDVPTPAYRDGHFFVLSDVQNSLSKVVARTGEVEWTTPLSRDYRWRSSPTVADGRVWVMNHNGQVVVLDEKSGEVVHEAQMGDAGDDQIRASLSVARGCVFVRTHDALFCIGKPDRDQ